MKHASEFFGSALRWGMSYHFDKTENPSAALIGVADIFRRVYTSFEEIRQEKNAKLGTKVVELMLLLIHDFQEWER